ncbi:MAG: prepilin peptidase [Candidatus Njordarchaeia archaeon]
MLIKEIILMTLFLLFLAFTAFLDFKKRTIDNRYSFLLIVYSLVLSTLCPYLINFYLSTMEITSFLILYKVRALGGGDVKVMSASAIIFPINTLISTLTSMTISLLLMKMGVEKPPIITIFCVSQLFLYAPLIFL